MNLTFTQSIMLLVFILTSFSSIFAFKIDQSTTTTTTFPNPLVGDIDNKSKIDHSFTSVKISVNKSSTTDQTLLLENEPETDTAPPNSDDDLFTRTLSSTFVTSISPLQMDLYEFIDLIPVDEVNELRVRYYVTDPIVRNAYDFIQSYNYTFVQTQLYKTVEVKKAIRFFERKGVNLNDIGEILNERLGPPLNFPDLTLQQEKPRNGGFYAFIDNILDEVPQDEIVTLFFEKMETSYVFAELLDWIGGNDFKELLNVLRVRKLGIFVWFYVM